MAIKFIKLYYPGQHEKKPKEDAWTLDEKHLIFAVADGVALYENIEYRNKYPNPSPAGKIAQKFCTYFVKYARHTNIKDAFKKANRAVLVLNKNRDRWNPEKAKLYYAATAAFGRIKGRYLEWGHICDAGIAAVAPNGEFMFLDDKCGSANNFTNPDMPSLSLSKYSDFFITLLSRTIYRNTTSSSKRELGYGIITGEKEAERFAVFQKTLLRKNIVYTIFTDGFSPYLKNKGFRNALVSLNPHRMNRIIRRLTQKGRKIKGLFRERTLIAFKII